MSKSVAILTTTLLAAVLLLSAYSPKEEKPVDIEVEAPFIDLRQECTKTLEVECAVAIEQTVVNCAKAIETEGVDVIADIKCAKDLLADKKDCWPCICAEAKKKGWKIIGCWYVIATLNMLIIWSQSEFSFPGVVVILENLFLAQLSGYSLQLFRMNSYSEFLWHVVPSKTVRLVVIFAFDV